MDIEKHTKGPWRVSEVRHKYDIVIRDPDNAPVAVVVLAGYPCAEAKANALLVATATELLAALKDVLRVADRSTAEFDAAHAAVAKATGARK